MAQYIVLAEWGIIGLFALIHFIIGYVRGVKKSLYYTFVSFVFTILSLFLISLVSIRPFFTNTSLIEFVERFVDIPNELKVSIMNNPDSLALIIALVDLVLKLVLFMVLYPVIKWLLTLIIARPIYKSIDGTKEKKKERKQLKKTNAPDHCFSNDLAKKSIYSRFLGGIFGMVRGVFSGLVTLLIFIVLFGFVNTTNTTNLNSNSRLLNSNNLLPSSVDEVFEIINEVNEKGPGLLLTKIKINNKTVANTLIDLAVTSKITYEDKTKNEKIKFSEEFGGFVNAGVVIYAGGYLDQDFDFKQISKDNLDDIKAVFDAFANSKIITNIIPTVSPLLIEYLLEQEEYVLERDFAKNSLKEFSKINLKNELQTTYLIIKEILETFDNVDEILSINFNNPLDYLKDLHENEPLKLERIINILTYLDDYNFTTILPLAIDFAIEKTDLKNNIKWRDDQGDYLRSKLDSFYLSNPYFLKNDKIFTKLSNILKIVLVDEIDYSASSKDELIVFHRYLKDSITNLSDELLLIFDNHLAIFENVDEEDDIDDLLETFYNEVLDQLEEENKEIQLKDYNIEFLFDVLNKEPIENILIDHKFAVAASEIIHEVTSINTIFNTIPILVDFAIYDVLGNEFDQIAEEKIQEILDIPVSEYTDYIEMFGDIYEILSSFGFKKALKSKKYGPIIKNILENNKDDLRNVMNIVLEKSESINRILNIGAELAIHKFVTNDLLKLGLLEVIEEEFNFGLEFKNIFKIIFEVLPHLPIDDLLQIDSFKQDDIINIGKELAKISEDSYLLIADLVTDLQIVNKFNVNLFKYVTSIANVEYLLIDEAILPTNFNIASDIRRVMDLGYYTAKYFIDAEKSYKDINLANLLLEDKITNFFNFDDDYQNSIIYLMMINAINVLLDKGSLDKFVVVPENIKSANYNDKLWLDEYNAIIHAVFEMVRLYSGDNTPLELSINNLKTISKDYKNLDLDVVTKLTSNFDNSFALIFNSKIVMASATKLLNNSAVSKLENLLPGFELSKDLLDENDVLLKEPIIDFIQVIFNMLDEHIEINNYTKVNEIVKFNLEATVNTFNNLSNDLLHDFAHTLLLNSTFRENLINEDVINKLNSIINNQASKLINADDLNIIRLEKSQTDGKINEDELYLLLFGIQSLKLDHELFVGKVKTANISSFAANLSDEQYLALLGSNILIELITNVLREDKVFIFAEEKINTVQSFIRFEKEIFEFPDEMFEDGLVKKEELVQLINVLKLFNFENNFKGIGIDTITNLYGANLDEEGNDDLDIVLNSIYIHTVIDKILKYEEVGNVIASQASKILNKDITYFDIKPLDEHLDESGKIKKQELRDIIHSISMLEISGKVTSDSVSLAKLYSFINLDKEEDEEDEMDLFLRGNYFHYLLQKGLSSNTFRTMIASSLGVDISLYNLETAKDENGHLKKVETYNLFRALKVLGLEDYKNIEFEVENILNLSDQQFDYVMDSTFIYQAVDLKIKEQFDDLPNKSFEDEGIYLGYIKKTEIKSIFNIFDILEVENINNIDPNSMTVLKLRLSLEEDSAIFNRFFSNDITTNIGELKEDAYELGSNKDLLKIELESFVDALEIIYGLDQVLGEIDYDNIDITKDQINEIMSLHDDQGGTRTLNRLMSKSIIKVLEGDDVIYQDAYDNDLDIDDESPLYNEDLERDEIKGLVEMINILNIDGVDNNVVVDEISVEDFDNLVNINKIIVNKLLSDSLKQVFSDNDVESALDDKEDIPNLEMKRLSMSIEPLEVDNLLELSNIEGYKLDITTLENVLNEDSLIVRRIISTNIIEELHEPDGYSGSSIKIDMLSLDIYEDENKKDIKKSELLEMADALTILGVLSLEDATLIDGNEITDEQLDELIIDNNSLIMKRVVSKALINADIVPPSALEANQKDVKQVELEGLVFAMKELNLTEVLDVTNIHFDFIMDEDNQDGFVTILENEDHTIIYQKVNDEIKDNLGDALNYLPLENFVDNDRGNNLTREYLINVIETN